MKLFSKHWNTHMILTNSNYILQEHPSANKTLGCSLIIHFLSRLKIFWLSLRNTYARCQLGNVNYKTPILCSLVKIWSASFENLKSYNFVVSIARTFTNNTNWMVLHNVIHICPSSQVCYLRLINLVRIRLLDTLSRDFVIKMPPNISMFYSLTKVLIGSNISTEAFLFNISSNIQ